MSFGFSVGDVLLLSQLTYQIYQSLTSGRKNASRDLTELGDVLFGLQCALDHLHHVVEDISTAASKQQEGTREEEMRAKLDQMVKNCATTLEDLISMTKKYREGAQQDNAEDDGISNQSSLTGTARLKQRLASNIMKIRWDMDKDTLRVYREKLQTHTDAINLVLNTFLWSSSKDILANSQAHTQQLVALHDQVVSSNSEFKKLVKDIQILVTQGKVQDPSGSTMLLGHQGSSQSMAMMDNCKVSSHNAKAYFAVAAPTPGVSLPVQTVAKAVPTADLPPSITSLNIKRQENAMKFVNKQHDVPEKLPPQRPTYFKTPEPTTDELIQGLDYMFSTNGKMHPDLSKDISAWARLLGRLVDSRISSSTSKPAMQHADLLELLIHLNDKLEKASDDMRQLFYRTSTAAHIDDILQRITTSTRSVRIEQVVDEFIDVRQEWIEDQI